MKDKRPGFRLTEWRAEENYPFSGWDFSHIDGRILEEKIPWSYTGLVKKLMTESRSLLDLGTGGGERLLALKDYFPEHVAATEGYRPNFLLARKKLGAYGVRVVHSPDGLTKPLPFGNESFDCVISRHTAYNIAEVNRVLVPGGIFLTQQVSGDSQEDLLAEFGVKPQWPYFTLKYAIELTGKTALGIVTAREWTGWMKVLDVGALVYHLKAIPWLVPGFSVDRYKKVLFRLHRRLKRTGELRFTVKRFLMKVMKQGTRENGETFQSRRSTVVRETRERNQPGDHTSLGRGETGI